VRRARRLPAPARTARESRRARRSRRRTRAAPRGRSAPLPPRPRRPRRPARAQERRRPEGLPARAIAALSRAVYRRPWTARNQGGRYGAQASSLLERVGQGVGPSVLESAEGARRAGDPLRDRQGPAPPEQARRPGETVRL